MAVGWRCEVEFAAVEENAGAVVVEVAKATSRRLDALDPTVKALGDRIGDAVPEVTQERAQMPLEHFGFVGQRLQSAADGPAVPVTEEVGRTGGVDVIPEAAKVFFDGPSAAGLERFLP